MFLYLQNETTYSIKFGLVLKPVMPFKTSEKEILHKMHTVVVVVTDISKDDTPVQKWNLKINSGPKGLNVSSLFIL